MRVFSNKFHELQAFGSPITVLFFANVALEGFTKTGFRCSLEIQRGPYTNVASSLIELTIALRVTGAIRFVDSI
jgi:hypothetical protein